MPPARSAKPAVPISRLRRFLLLELPGWLILAVSVAYTTSAGNGRITIFFQLVLLSAALAWLFGGRVGNLTLGSLLCGWAAGTMANFNLLAIASIGIFLLPVTAFVLIVLVLLMSGRNLRSRAAAVGGMALASAVQFIFLGLFAGR
ncbi:MAG TPA: hypothetical protein VIP52_04990 [Candidatus Dormibacteraeota bacterium]|jgi:hypothetical protein